MDDFGEHLEGILAATQQQIGAILRRLRRGDSDPLELVALLEALSPLDRERAKLLEQARLEASASQRREQERSTRQYVLHALEEVGAPQTAGFLDEYIYTRERVVLNTRGFGALRRDENRAWRRNPGRRRAYIVPCLDGAGNAVARWMSRSDWPLSTRIVAEGAEELWERKGVLALAKALRDEQDDVPAGVYLPLLEKCAWEAWGPDGPSTDSRDWPLEVERTAAAEVERLTRDLAGAQLARAARFEEALDPEQLLWGIGSSASTRATGTARAGRGGDGGVE
jgi:hypothetical protein